MILIKQQCLKVSDIDLDTYDLSVKNPNRNNEVILREPKEILEEIKKLDKESEMILEKIGALL